MAVNWERLVSAFRDTTDIPVKRDSFDNVNSFSKDKDGYYVESSGAPHAIYMVLADDLEGYSVSVRVDIDNKITSSIKIKDVGNFDFPITGQDEHFTERVNMTPWLEKFRKDEKSVSQLKRIFDWVNKVCLDNIKER